MQFATDLAFASVLGLGLGLLLTAAIMRHDVGYPALRWIARVILRREPAAPAYVQPAGQPFAVRRLEGDVEIVPFRPGVVS